ncbi:MAG TPA: NAD(P)-binding domain-containing protein [Kofleriaceae bacterium]|nr:NAD(P)-binding domain-containing protein [Kofleriaceae bacterium]
MSQRTLGMIGLGRTGLPVAFNLLARGHAVVGYRRSDAADLVRAGGRAARSPREVADSADIILSLLPSAAALDDVMTGEHGLLAGLGPRHTVVELSSYPLAVKERYRDLVAARGATLLDGEISGTPAMTASRTAVVLVAGDRTRCEAVLDVCRDATDHAIYAGAFGSATRLKLVANLLVAVHTAAAAEALLLVERIGLDVPLAIEVLGLGAGSSAMFRARAASMAARRFVDPAPGPVSMLSAYLPAIDALAASAGAPVPLFSAAAELLRAALGEGRGDQDIGCVIELLDAANPPTKGTRS